MNLPQQNKKPIVMFFLIAFGLFTSLLNSAQASNWSLFPASKTLENNKNSYLIKISNNGTEKLNVFLESKIRYLDKKGNLKPINSSTVRVFPKLLVIQPGKTKKARVLIDKNTTNAEIAYVTKIIETPHETNKPQMGLKTYVAYNINLYSLPDSPITKKPLIYSLKEGIFKVTNPNNTHSIFITKNSSVKLKGTNVLAGTTREFTVPKVKKIEFTLKGKKIIVVSQ
jgi:hypothetical protein